MKFIKNKKWIIAATVFFTIFLIYTANSSYPIESKLKFDANVDTFYFIGNETYVNFESKILSLSTNEIAFNYVTNIEFKDDIKVIDIEDRSILLVKFNGTKSLQLNDANVNTKFNNLAIKKEIGITLDGYLNNNNNNVNFLYFYGNNSVNLKKSEIENVMVINNDTITEVSSFDELTFKMDDSSNVGLKTHIDNLLAVGISNLNIISNASEVEIEQSQGVLKLNDHKFDIEKVDTLNIIMSKNHYDFNLKVEDTSMILRNASNSAKLNNKDLIMSDFSYWLYKAPETVFSGINALFVMILVFLTGWYANSTKSMLEEQRSTLDEQRKTRKIIALSKKLERVYSPIEEALTEFDLESTKFLNENPNCETLPTEIKDIFEKLTENMLAVKKHYGYLIDFDTTASFKDVWNIYLSLDGTTNRKQTDTFIALTKVFHTHISTKISDYMDNFNDLQR